MLMWITFKDKGIFFVNTPINIFGTFIFFRENEISDYNQQRKSLYF